MTAAASRTAPSPLQKMSQRDRSFSAWMRFIASPVPSRTVETLIPVFFSKPLLTRSMASGGFEE